MKAKSAKAKGSRFEKLILDYIREHLDAHAYTPLGSGNGLEKGDIYLPKHEVVVEVKNQKNIDLKSWWSQAEEQAHNQIPALVIRHPDHAEGKKTLAVMFFEDYVELLKKQHQEVVLEESVANYEVRNAIAKLESATKSLKKKYRL